MEITLGVKVKQKEIVLICFVEYLFSQLRYEKSNFRNSFELRKILLSVTQ